MSEVDVAPESRGAGVGGGTAGGAGRRSGPGVGEQVVRFFSSYALSSFLLLVLFALTFVGTYYQRTHGLYAAQKRFFESLFVYVDVGGTAIPVLPGGALAMGLLALNLLLGGLVRIRKNWNTAGIIVVHVGIVLMLAAGLVKHQFSDDGYLRLYEGEQSDEFVSFYKWEVAIFEAEDREDVVEHLIPHDQLIDLTGGRRRVFTSAELPFELTLHTFVPNCWPARKGPMWESPGPTIDGWALKAEPWNKQAENNVAGMYAEVRDDSGLLQQTLLHGFETYPWTFESGGRTWAVSLRHKRYAMPWTVRLEDFTKEDHPRMTMARSFMSDVTVIEEDEQTKVRIQMNEPLREDGLILFQASWGPPDARPGQPLFSQFAVVRNPSDSWPLISCIIIAIGMTMAFVMKLMRFVRRQGRERERGTATS